MSATTFLPPQTYRSVDSIPEVAAARQIVRDEAWSTVQEREALLRGGQESLLPLTIDALSTAKSVAEAEAVFGFGSPEHLDRRAGLDMDCLRLVGEWYRKLRPEYFAPLHHQYDAQADDYYSHGYSIGQLTNNALRPIEGDPEEVDRRVNEKVENETPRILRSLGAIALDGVKLRTISECTDKAIDDYERDIKEGKPHSGYGGMVPEIEKLMIRDVSIDSATGDRYVEQVALPAKKYLQHEVILEALRRRNLETVDLDKTDLHGTQILAGDTILEFVAHLDQVAGEEWCTNIFMGEEVPADYVKDYDGFREEAIERQVEITGLAGTVASFILDLEADGYDPRKAPAKIEEFVKLLLLKEAKKETALAENMFGPTTALKLAEVVALEAQGRTQEAFTLFEETRESAPGGGYCSGGSCGLKPVDESSEEGKDLAEKLELEGDETLVRDTERACKCGKKTIVYAYNEDTVKKYCESCHAFEKKKTK
ncbi:MAG: hypothetical protein KIH63_003690 [Candidatus Saccharibacteria bacterium]|nr:hypothetical protein [Candidatus Saccharibacteria bacterium]